MSRFRLCLALGLTAAFAISLASSLRPPAPQPAAAPPAAAPIALLCDVDPASLGRPIVILRGTTSLPNGTPLSMIFTRFREQDHDGRLEAELVDEGFESCDVLGGRFTCGHRLLVQGLYRVRVDSADPLRRRHWDFEFALWNDEHLLRVEEEYRGLLSQIEQLWELRNTMSNWATMESLWMQRGVRLLPDAAKILELAEKASYPRSYFPAARKDFPATARLLADAPLRFFWKPDGKFGGAFDTETMQWVKGPDQRPFDFDRMLGFLSSQSDLAHREFALWIVKEQRRSGVTPRLRTAIRSSPPNVRRLVAGLNSGKNVDTIEENIRGEAHPIPRRPDPPIPPQFQTVISHRKKVEEARKLLAEADDRWGRFPDDDSPRLYRRLATDYPETLEELGAASRVRNRARE
jgi:hypothetical protein